MGAYNTVVLPWRHPSTGGEIRLVVQFKYGDTWQYEYQLGDELKWGGNDNGLRDVRRVVVDGVRDAPDDLPGVPEDFEVYIVDNRISEVKPATGRYNFVAMDRPYVVLEE